MRRWTWSVAFAAGILGLGCVAAYAAEDPPKKETRTTTTTTEVTTQRTFNQFPRRIEKASEIIGKDLDAVNGDDLGDIDDIIVDITSGRAIYAIVACDAPSGQCVVPMTALDLSNDGKKFVIAGTKETLKAFAFNKTSFPEVTDRTWATRIHTHYRKTPYWERVEVVSDGPVKVVSDSWYQFTNHWHKGSDILGKEVRNPQNENLGEIQDLAIDPDTGRVVYGVLSFGGFLGMGDKLFAIPWSSLNTMTGDHKQFVLNIDKAKLKNASGFDKKNWPNMADARWAADVHSFYGQQPYWQDTNRP